MKSLHIIQMMILASAAIVLGSKVRMQGKKEKNASLSLGEDTHFILIREPRPALTTQSEFLLVEME